MAQVKSEPISIQNANQMYSSLKEIKERTKDKILTALKDDEEALRYYLGEEVAFFFTKGSVGRLWDIISDQSFNDGNSGFALYRGTRFDKELNVNGRPTLMAFAYKVVDGKNIQILAKNGNELRYDESTQTIVISGGQLDPSGDGEEHPGGGDDSGSFRGEIPLLFPDSSVHVLF